MPPRNFILRGASTSFAAPPDPSQAQARGRGRGRGGGVGGGGIGLGGGGMSSRLNNDSTQRTGGGSVIGAKGKEVDKDGVTTAKDSNGVGGREKEKLMLGRDPSGRTRELETRDDICPVCHTDRYQNPRLRIMVSNRCYHKMCTSCIDRLYTVGPNPCPVIDCYEKSSSAPTTNGMQQQKSTSVNGMQRTVLRKNNFDLQTFEDLRVEKEVRVRRRVGKLFNKRPEDFPNLKEYNDYLEEVEMITFNLINSIDVPSTESRLKKYEKDNLDSIEENEDREKKEKEDREKGEEEEKKIKEERRKEAERMVEEERRDKEELERKVLEELENSNDSASRIAAKSRKAMIKKHSARNAAFEGTTRRTRGARGEQEEEEMLRRGVMSKYSHLFSNTSNLPTHIEETTPSTPNQPDIFSLSIPSRWYSYQNLFTLPNNLIDSIRKISEKIPPKPQLPPSKAPISSSKNGTPTPSGTSTPSAPSTPNPLNTTFPSTLPTKSSSTNVTSSSSSSGDDPRLLARYYPMEPLIMSMESDPKVMAGGWDIKEGWVERCVRMGVEGVWEMPLGWGEEEGAEEKGKGEDVVMTEG